MIEPIVLRQHYEFDKAAATYEKALADNPEEAEVYWGICLSKYGVEYVDDPRSGERKPTCHRTLLSPIKSDLDYKQAVKYATPEMLEIYSQSADEIDKIQQKILDIVKKEKPYDIFICYKETDDQGRRTQDSVDAHDLYNQLTKAGYRVFFSRITLESKLGSEYEPYIYAALSSAKAMIVYGSRPEYFNAVWVKNEWNRFLSMNADDDSKILIPAYKNMNPYDLPEEMGYLQAQDMGKIGALQDLLHGIQKVIRPETTKNKGECSAALRRAQIALEDGEWEKAHEYFERVLDKDPECGEAYIGELLAELKVHEINELSALDMPFDKSKTYKRAYRFADKSIRAKLSECNDTIRKRNKQKKLQALYDGALNVMNSAEDEIDYRKAADRFRKISPFQDAEEKANICIERAKECRRRKMYQVAVDELSNADEEKQERFKWIDEKRAEKQYQMALEGLLEAKLPDLYQNAVNYFNSAEGWSNSEEKIKECREKISQVEDRLTLLREECEKQTKINLRIRQVLIVAAVLSVLILVVSVIYAVQKPRVEYERGLSAMEKGDYALAVSHFSSSTYSDASKYAEYASVLLDLDSLQESKAIGDLYDRINVLGNFQGAYKLLSQYDEFQLIESLQGTWFSLNSERPYISFDQGNATLFVWSDDDGSFETYYSIYLPTNKEYDLELRKKASNDLFEIKTKTDNQIIVSYQQQGVEQYSTVYYRDGAAKTEDFANANDDTGEKNYDSNYQDLGSLLETYIDTTGNDDVQICRQFFSAYEEELYEDDEYYDARIISCDGVVVSFMEWSDEFIFANMAIYDTCADYSLYGVHIGMDRETAIETMAMNAQDYFPDVYIDMDSVGFERFDDESGQWFAIWMQFDEDQKVIQIDADTGY